MQKLAVMVVADTVDRADKFGEEVGDFLPRVLRSPRPGASLVNLVTITSDDVEQILKDEDAQMCQKFNVAESRIIVGVGEATNMLFDQLEESLQLAYDAGDIQASEAYRPRILRMSDALIHHCHQIKLKTVAMMPRTEEHYGEALVERRLRAAGLTVAKLDNHRQRALRELALDASIQLDSGGGAELAFQFRQAADALVAPYAQVLAFDGSMKSLLKTLESVHGRLPVLVDLQELYLEMIRDWVLKLVELYIAKGCSNDAPPPTTKVVARAVHG